MSINSCFSEIVPDVFPLLHCVNTNLIAPDLQTAKTPAFTEALTLADDELMKCI